MRIINADAIEEYLWKYIDGYEIPGVLEAISEMPTIEMNDLISRKYAIEHYQHVCRRTSCKECPLHIQVTDTLTDCELELFLHNLPPAEPERKKGKWIDEPVYKQTMDGKTWDGYTYCSECKEMHEYGYRSNFCPNCGADMRKR